MTWAEPLRQQSRAEFIRGIIEIPEQNFHLHSYAATSSRHFVAGDNEPGTVSTASRAIPDT